MESQPTQPAQDAESRAHSADLAASGRRLEYNTRTSLVTRGQMRFFLLLLTINTILFAAFICMPTVSPFLKKWLEDSQAQREQKRQQAETEAQAKRDAAARRDIIAECAQYTALPDQVVYAEAPAEVFKLLASAGRAFLVDGSHPLGGGANGGGGGLFGGGGGGAVSQPIFNDARGGDQLRQSGWQPPAGRAMADSLASLVAASDARAVHPNIVFLHQMTAPSGVKRIVWISFEAEPTLELAYEEADLREFDLVISRRFNVSVFDEALGNRVITSAIMQTAAGQLTTMSVTRDPVDSLENVDLQRLGEWRIFAGQIDPKNPAHLTIAYDIDGKTGVIDGWLKDGDRLMLEPRVGKLTTWNSGSEYIWDLSPTAATKPTK